jgi:pimeloyl-ACP methyl ester carboxylesterase
VRTIPCARLVLLTLLLSGCVSAPVRVPQPIDEARFITVGGIEQWITIRGDDRSNPVVLFLHGGPGNTLTPFADAIYGHWAGELTLVQWDQRGAGKTFGRNPPPEALTLERMTQDGIEVAAHVARHLGKDSIILLGGSWGSILGVHMIRERPDLFHAYVGVSQVVSKVENQAATYARLVALAREAGDEPTRQALENIGAPPWRNPRHPGAIRRITRTYEAKTTVPAPSEWWLRASEYATTDAMADYTEGEDFSFLQFVGSSDDGMYSKVDLPSLGLKFDVPVYLIQGAEDLVTTREVTERYFERIDAPGKKLIIVPAAGHDPNEAVIRATYKVLQEL